MIHIPFVIKRAFLLEQVGIKMIMILIIFDDNTLYL